MLVLLQVYWQHLQPDLATLFASSSDTGFTVFAPTDTAFTNTLNTLGLELSDLAANTTLLTEILLYHVVDGVTKSADLSEGQMIATKEGQTVTYSMGKINDASITTADLRAYNGIVHVIDNVLVPTSAANTLAEDNAASTTFVSSSLLALSTFIAAAMF